MPINELIANKALARRLHVTVRTLFRWSEQHELGFPAHLVIAGRRYFSVPEIAWLAARRPGAVAQAVPDLGPAIVASTAKPKPSPIDRRNATELMEAD